MYPSMEPSSYRAARPASDGLDLSTQHPGLASANLGRSLISTPADLMFDTNIVMTTDYPMTDLLDSRLITDYGITNVTVAEGASNEKNMADCQAYVDSNFKHSRGSYYGRDFNLAMIAYIVGPVVLVAIIAVRLFFRWRARRQAATAAVSEASMLPSAYYTAGPGTSTAMPAFNQGLPYPPQHLNSAADSSSAVGSPVMLGPHLGGSPAHSPVMGLTVGAQTFTPAAAAAAVVDPHAQHNRYGVVQGPSNAAAPAEYDSSRNGYSVLGQPAVAQSNSSWWHN
eukprot:gene8594-8776_t